MRSGEVLEVLDALAAANLRLWLDGGWGVDALVGHQTRDHDDVDIVVELAAVPAATRALGRLGDDFAEDHLPTCAVLRAVDGREINLHPVISTLRAPAGSPARTPTAETAPSRPRDSARASWQTARCRA